MHFKALNKGRDPALDILWNLWNIKALVSAWTMWVKEVTDKPSLGDFALALMVTEYDCSLSQPASVNKASKLR